MILISQNKENYNLTLPKEGILRINLAWCNSLKELEIKLAKNKKSEFFIDLPIGRIKPPNNSYSLDDMIPIIEDNPCIKYLAVSNVENKNDLQPFLEKLPDYINIVPKIESQKAILNIKEICDSLKTEKKIVMLDHDDLFSSIIHNNEDKNKFLEHIKSLIDFCNANSISLLRTVGVAFSDDEKRTTQYEKKFRILIRNNMKNFIVFPFLLAFLPSWQLILKNYDELIFQDILISLAIIAISVIVWIVITKIIKNGNKAALITGVGVAFFFYFGYVQDALDGIIIFNIPIDKTSVLVIISIIIFITSTIYFVKSRKNFELSIKVANVFTITLILFTLVQFVIPGALAEKPNVYHIILDEYTDNEI